MAPAVATIVSDRRRKTVWRHQTLVRMGRLELPSTSVRGRVSAADLHPVDVIGFLS